MRSLLRRWWRVAPLAFALLAGSASAQVAGLCGSGKNCTVNRVAGMASRNAYTWNFCNSIYPGTYSMGWGSYAASNQASWLIYVGQNCQGTASQVPLNYVVLSGVWNVPTGYHWQVTDGLETGANGTGTAYASFPTCNAAATGRLLFDSTNNLWRFCDGAYWRPLQSSSEPTYTYASAGFSSICFGTCSTESTNFTGSYSPRSDNERGTQKISCSWGTAGTGGTTGVVVRIYDGSAEVCSCTLGACTTAANTALSCACAAGLLASSKNYTVQLKSTTDCTGNPANIVCNVE